MNSSSTPLLRAVLPLCVFIAVLELHLGWHVWRHAQDPNAACCPAGTSIAACCESNSASGLENYLDSQSYWLGLSYAFPLAFAAAAFRRYRERRSAATARLALGGVTFSGALAGTACFLTGCCGSPMLAVYANLFGAAYLPFAKPLVAALSAVSVLGAWWWMNRVPKTNSGCGCAGGKCGAEVTP